MIFLFIKILFLTIPLVWWNTDPNCRNFSLTLIIISFFLTMSFAENQLLYRKSFANIVFKNTSFFYKWLHKRWFVLFSSFLKAIIVSILFLLSILHLENKIILVLFFDIAIILLLYHSFIKYFSMYTKSEVTHLMARKWTVIVNISIMIPIIVFIMLYTPQPEFLDIPLVSCNTLNLLLKYDAIRDAFSWWVVFKASYLLEGSKYVLLLYWLIFLMLQTFYIWIFSSLILSSTISIRQIFPKINQYNKVDKFSLGFFGIIGMFFIISLIYLPNEINIDKSDSNITKILTKFDATINQEKKDMIENVNHCIDLEVNRVFKNVYKQIPQYVDKQYLWYKDYIDIYNVTKQKAVNGWNIWSFYINRIIWDIDVAYPSLKNTQTYAQKSSDELQQILFLNGKFDQDISEMQLQINEFIQQQIDLSKANITNSLVSLKNNTSSKKDLELVQNLNQSIDKSFLEAKNSLKQATLTYKVTEVGIASILTKTIMTKLLAKSGVKVIAKTGIKTVAKAGGFLEGATTGLAVCAPSGPWALACGAVTGTITWVGVDFTFSKVDNILTREVFEEKLRTEIKRNEEIYKQKLQQTYTQSINNMFKKLDQPIDKRPIDTIK